MVRPRRLLQANPRLFDEQFIAAAEGYADQGLLHLVSWFESQQERWGRKSAQAVQPRLLRVLTRYVQAQVAYHLLAREMRQAMEAGELTDAKHAVQCLGKINHYEAQIETCWTVLADLGYEWEVRLVSGWLKWAAKVGWK